MAAERAEYGRRTSKPLTSLQPVARFSAVLAFSRSPQLGASSFAAGTHRDWVLAAFGAPIGNQPMIHRVIAAISSASRSPASPLDPPPSAPSVVPGRGVIDPPSRESSESRATFRN